MKKTFTLLYLLVFLCQQKTNAQTTKDTLNFGNQNWETVNIGHGLTWKHYQFTDKSLFNANQNIHIVTSKRKTWFNRRRSLVAFVSDLDSLELTSVLAKQYKAFAAINGSFFDTKKGGAVDFIRIGGQILDTTRHNAKRIAEHQMSALVIKNNKISIVKARDSIDFRWETQIDAPNVMVTGPLLIWDGKRGLLSINAFNDNRHPRSCACVTNKNELILLTADGRTAEAQGLNLHELTTLMLSLNCREAVNLDGGGSTTLYLEGKGVVNMPCDNKKFDHEGERKVSNILILKAIDRK
jgi:exopolysaccharide biosynthesis protein